MTVAADDRGLLLGDGLFETILWSGGALAAFEAHARRLERGCAALGLPSPDIDRLAAAALAALARADLLATRAAVRLTWTAGGGGRGLDRPAELAPRLFASATPSAKPTGGARVAIVDIRRNEGSPVSRLKTLACLDNVLARRAARLAGADEALMLNNRGEVACAAAANLFWFEDETLVTPALECGVLDGIIRASVIECAGAMGLQVRPLRASPEALTRARGLFLTNSLIGLRPIDALDGAPSPSHPTVAVLAGAIADQKIA